MMLDLEVWHIATVMLMIYGPDATYEAGSMADEMVKLGDLEAAVQWIRVTEAVDELQQQTSSREALLQ